MINCRGKTVIRELPIGEQTTNPAPIEVVLTAEGFVTEEEAGHKLGRGNELSLRAETTFRNKRVLLVVPRAKVVRWKWGSWLWESIGPFRIIELARIAS